MPASNGHPAAVARTADMALLKQRRHSDPGDIKQQQQQTQTQSVLGKRQAAEAEAADTVSKRLRVRRGSGAAGTAGGAAAADRPGGRAGLAAIADKHLAVGCRVSVYWRLDKLFYRVGQQAVLHCMGGHMRCAWVLHALKLPTCASGILWGLTTVQTNLWQWLWPSCCVPHGASVYAAAEHIMACSFGQAAVAANSVMS